MKPESCFCRIYEADVTPLASSALFDRYYARMPAWRRMKADRLRHPEGKRLSLGAGILLMYGLNASGIDGAAAVFSEGPHGKPFLRDFPEVHFNLSHAGTRVLCVLSSLPCGCDVEQAGRGSPALARRFFTPEEEKALEAERSGAGEAAFHTLFTRIWTRKESFLKATGEGLSRPMSSFSVLEPDPSVRFLEAEPKQGYAACVCLLTDPSESGLSADSVRPVPEWIHISLENPAREDG